MSKRFYPQQHGERKKAKLDITISDHNFPLSQNVAANDDLDNWGDDNDDEILLMASQACEQAYGNNSSLPDFSLCMQPGATSTQMFPQPGPSKEFAFKKPSINSPHLTSTHLKDKCNRISSPLPGMSSKVISNEESMKYNDDLIYNDKVYKGQDPDHAYWQLLQLQEENAKLKSENGKLMDKCVTKEGEASILRTQLKSCQVAVDNARMEKIKAQEKVQMEWTEKLSAVNGQMHDLRTQLDFKNLEIISIKERCRMLESTKVKLTQVTVPNNEISSSHRNNMSSTHNASLTQRRVKMASTGAQTDSKAHFLKLYKSHSSATPNLTSILPPILEPSAEQPSLLDHNEKLQTDREQSQQPCRVFSTFHRLPATAVTRPRGAKMTVGCIHEDLTCIAEGVNVAEKFDKIMKATCAVLRQVQQQLTEVRARVTAAFQRDMDLRYIHAASTYLLVTRRNLLSGRALYKEEQGILARRMVATVAVLLYRSTRAVPEEQVKSIADNVNDGILHVLGDVCALLDATSCAPLYNGLLCSTTLLLEALPSPSPRALLKSLISCRPMPSVSCRVLRVLRKMVAHEGTGICGGSGNMRVDLEQGVLLYKKESCHLHVLLKQVEVALGSSEVALGSSEVALGSSEVALGSAAPALATARELLALRHHGRAADPRGSRSALTQVEGALGSSEVALGSSEVALGSSEVALGSSEVALGSSEVALGSAAPALATARELLALRHHGRAADPRGSRCDCQLLLIQVLVFALRICSVMLKKCQSSKDDLNVPDLLATCRAGVLVLHQLVSRDVEFCSQLGLAEGPALEFIETMRDCSHPELWENMLIELAGTFQCAAEDSPPSFHRQAWVKSFQTFSLVD